MDADATTGTECLLACGSFFCLHAAADAAEAHSTATDVVMTAACGSSFCSLAVVDSATTDADADVIKTSLTA